MTSEIIDILVLDDEESIRWVIGKTLKRPAYRLHFSASAEEAARVMDSRKVDLALVDINLPGQDGLSFITSQLELRPGVLMAVITGQGTMNHAVQAMKAGAFDYLTKPFDIEELEEMVERAARTIRQTRSSEGGPAPQVEPRVGEQDTIIGVSRALREVYKAIGRVADSDLTVLILGESGTGKELIARAIHTNSGRAPEPFVAVNCAAIPRELLEAELFGHEKGAFTGAVEKKSGRLESAGLGTVFLDEIGDMSLELQAKLLRVLQEREYQPVGGVETRRMKARVLAATNQSLEEAVAQGRFRADLFYRVNAFTINVPPLRERREDILVLARHFLALTGKKLELPLPVLTEAAGRLLEEYDWPGNVRELENVIKSLLITVHGRVIDIRDLPRNIAGEGFVPDVGEDFEAAVLRLWKPAIRKACAEPDEEGTSGLLEQVGRHMERPLIRQVLLETGWNQLRTARVLGINRNTLRTKMRALGIKRGSETGARRGRPAAKRES